MVEPELLSLLCCPETRQALRPVDPAALDQLNRRIAAGGLKNCAGQPITRPIDGALLRADGKVLYPVIGNIPVMLPGAALPLD